MPVGIIGVGNFGAKRRATMGAAGRFEIHDARGKPGSCWARRPV